ncbi:hypothetical protein WJX72_006402 [[Myrmecia] bisecta]|uniref:RING-type E3 ubiquitin transferase n=1 Tax=[Myrmecia] bisecta TaxID=41462 RepID=A0AAW1R717_9CHLO
MRKIGCSALLAQLLTVLCAAFCICCEARAFPQVLDSQQAAEQALQVSEQLVDSLPYAFPANISGAYKGSWDSLLPAQEAGEGAAVGDEQSHMLSKDAGLVILQLKSFATPVEGVHDIEGELVIRDGVYVTEEDVLMKVTGVYVVGAGRLHAVAEPAKPLELNVEPDDVEEQGPVYRQALRDAAKDWTQPGFPPVVVHHLAANQQLKKRCEFMLELSVSHLADAVAGQSGHSARLTSSELDALQDELDEQAAANQWGLHSDAALPTPVYVPPAEQSDVVLNGTLISSNCGISLGINATTTHVETYYAKAVNYTLMVTALSFVQVLLLIRQMESTSTQSGTAKVSLLSIGQQAIMDAYLCLLHLTTGIMVEPLFNAFATAAFFEFVIFAIFEMRYLLSIWRARRDSSADPWTAVTAQRELSVLYARFYSALLGGIFLMYQMQRYLRVLVFGLYSFWIPQIVFCARNDVAQPLRPFYILGMTATRLMLPLYLFGCPSNLLRIPPNPPICAALAVWMAVQVGVLLLQSRKGPRFFIPACFLPAKYDYHRKCTPRQLEGSEGPEDIETGGGAECVICMNPVDVERPAGRMVTPCGHFFHQQCLQRWMDVKMECPTCRTVLPPP